tara:strand:- start:350 stop:913 length:564 start_codon:yes stop_codon:yes gene_type:complete
LKNKRIFIGIPVKVNLNTVVEMIQTTVDAPYGDIKWVYGKNLHLTLAFVGNLEESQIKDIITELESMNFGQPFNAVLNYTGLFPNPENPNVFWLGIDKGRSRLNLIVDQIHSILNKLSLPINDKKFIPHVTIGKVRKNIDSWKIGTSSYLNAVFSPTRFLVNSIHLYESAMTEKGVKYTSIVSNSLQ